MSVIDTRASALSAPAIAAAAVSAFMLQQLPFSSYPIVEITGIKLWFKTSSITSVFTSLISPTNPWQSSSASHFIIFPSIPESPIACPPIFPIWQTRSLLTLPASTICTTSTVSLSVTLNPFSNLLSICIFSRVLFIAGPPP